MGILSFAKNIGRTLSTLIVTLVLDNFGFIWLFIVLGSSSLFVGTLAVFQKPPVLNVLEPAEDNLSEGTDAIRQQKIGNKHEVLELRRTSIVSINEPTLKTEDSSRYLVFIVFTSGARRFQE